MGRVLQAFSRALVSQLHPRMLLLLLLPMALTLVGWVVAASLVWDPLIAFLREGLFGEQRLSFLAEWVDVVGLRQTGAMLSAVIALLLLAPAMLLISMLLVSVLATPLVLTHLQRGRYASLQARGGWSLLQGIGVAVAALAIFAVGYLLTLPLWLVPLAGLLVPWFWWGWLSARVLRFDTLSAHADPGERDLLIRRHRGEYLLLGLLLSALNAIPPLFLITPVLSVLAFAHFSLAALQALRGARDPQAGGGYTVLNASESAASALPPAASHPPR